MSGVEDVLKKLLPAMFRGVHVFATSFTFGFSHQHVPALFPDRDAGYVDATGRNPAAHNFTLLFSNGNLGATEVQYPDAWRKMVRACLDRSSGELMHPELGPMKVKVADCTTQWDAKSRGGVGMTVAFTETSDAEDELSKILGKSAAYAVEIEAGQLDKISTVGALAAEDEELSPTLLDSLKQMKGSIAMFENDLGRVASLVESYANAIGDLTDKLEELDDPANSPAIEALKRLHAGVLDIAEAARPKARPVTMVVVQSDAPTSAVASFFGNSLEEILSLNPAAGKKTSLSAGDSLFVYAA